MSCRTPNFTALKEHARACVACAPLLPLGPRPVVRGTSRARLLIVGQAPGIRVHRSGTPWDDPSGDRLRQWLAIDSDTFYDENRIAIVPMGLCYPGENPKGGDNPPRPECAPLWQTAFYRALPDLRLTLLIGRYAQLWYLRDQRPPDAPWQVPKTMTETVAAWEQFGFRDGEERPAFFPLPHPSWRNSAWIKKNPWFSDAVLPALRDRCHHVLAQHPKL